MNTAPDPKASVGDVTAEDRATFKEACVAANAVLHNRHGKPWWNVEEAETNNAGASVIAAHRVASLAAKEAECQRDLESDSIVASCNCLTKTNDFRLHKPGCKYRLISERDLYLAERNYDCALWEKQAKLAGEWEARALMAEGRLERLQGGDEMQQGKGPVAHGYGHRPDQTAPPNASAAGGASLQEESPAGASETSKPPKSPAKSGTQEPVFSWDNQQTVMDSLVLTRQERDSLRRSVKELRSFEEVVEDLHSQIDESWPNLESRSGAIQDKIRAVEARFDAAQAETRRLQGELTAAQLSFTTNLVWMNGVLRKIVTMVTDEDFDADEVLDYATAQLAALSATVAAGKAEKT